MDKIFEATLSLAIILFFSGYAYGTDYIGSEVDSEVVGLQNIRRKIEGKSDQEVGAMMDTNGDGKLTKGELKQGLADLSEVELDAIESDEVNLAWDILMDPSETIDLQDPQIPQVE